MTADLLAPGSHVLHKYTGRLGRILSGPPRVKWLDTPDEISTLPDPEELIGIPTETANALRWPREGGFVVRHSDGRVGQGAGEGWLRYDGAVVDVWGETGSYTCIPASLADTLRARTELEKGDYVIHSETGMVGRIQSRTLIRWLETGHEVSRCGDADLIKISPRAADRLRTRETDSFLLSLVRDVVG